MKITTKENTKDRTSTEKPVSKWRRLMLEKRKNSKSGGFDFSIKNVSFGIIDPLKMKELSSYHAISRNWAGEQARAILAVDNIRPTKEGEELAQAVENGVLSYQEAIQVIVNRAHEYASRQ
jgi:hypothetical protein